MVGLMYKKDDIVFITYESFLNYVQIINSGNGSRNFYDVYQITKPVRGNRDYQIEYYLTPTNSRLCCGLEKLLVGAYDEI